LSTLTELESLVIRLDLFPDMGLFATPDTPQANHRWVIDVLDSASKLPQLNKIVFWMHFQVTSKIDAGNLDGIVGSNYSWT
jgi:hypothetical protein